MNTENQNIEFKESWRENGYAALPMRRAAKSILACATTALRVIDLLNTIQAACSALSSAKKLRTFLLATRMSMLVKFRKIIQEMALWMALWKLPDLSWVVL